MNAEIVFALVGVITALITLVTLVTKYFIRAITSKDEQIVGMVKDFNLTVNNHIIASNQQRKENTEVMQSMIQTMERFPDQIATHIINGVSKLLPIASASQANVTVNTAPVSAEDPKIITN